MTEVLTTPETAQTTISPFTPERVITPHILLTQPQESMDKLSIHQREVVSLDACMQYFAARDEAGIPPDVLFLLDKGARLLDLPIRKLYKDYCPNSELPEIRFINIGRGGVEPQAVRFIGDPSIIATRYKGFNPNGRIVIVDEYADTGETIQQAIEKLKQAYPHATEVSGLVAFPKPIYGNLLAEAGVSEYTREDYKKMALDRLNAECNTTYTGESDPTLDHDSRRRLTEYYYEEIGNIPHVKPRERTVVPLPRKVLPLSEMIKQKRVLSKRQYSLPNQDFRHGFDAVIKDVRELHKRSG